MLCCGASATWHPPGQLLVSSAHQRSRLQLRSCGSMRSLQRRLNGRWAIWTPWTGAYCVVQSLHSHLLKRCSAHVSNAVQILGP